MDAFIAEATERRVASERWQARVETGLTALDRRVEQVEERVEVA